MNNSETSPTPPHQFAYCCAPLSLNFSNMKLRLKVPWLSSSSTKNRKPGKEGAANGANGLNGGNGKNQLMNLKNLPQPQWTNFEGANQWQPEQHVVLYCMNDQDNVPARMKLDDFVFYISQSRSPGHKDQGQDCMATATHKEWDIHVLCDGHDKLGHMVALGVCQQLPKILLRMIHEREASEVSSPVSDKLINAAFDECSKIVCWTSEGITVGIWVKVFEGQWADKPGYIKEGSSAGKVRVAIIDENGYHLPPIDRKMLRRPRYTGGCTCVCLIRNKVTKECKIAVSGDSRLVILPTQGINDAVLQRQRGVVEHNEPDSEEGSNQKANGGDTAKTKEAGAPAEVAEGLVTPAHNVFNEEERARLQQDYAGQYEFDGNFLVNPITKFAIQPTRGFGDFDMFGTGYTHVPEITKTFKLGPDSLIFTASDGVFDTHVWQDEEIITCLDKYIQDGLSSAQIAENMYRETLQRSLEGGYVDDISMFCYREPKAENGVVEVKVVQPEPLTEELEIPTEKVVKKKKDTKEKRRTIGRGGDSYSDLSAQVLQMRALKLQEQSEREIKDKPVESAAPPTAPSAEKEANKENFDDENALAKVVSPERVGALLKTMAVSQGLIEFENMDPAELVTGSSFSAKDQEEDEEMQEKLAK